MLSDTISLTVVENDVPFPMIYTHPASSLSLFHYAAVLPALNWHFEAQRYSGRSEQNGAVPYCYMNQSFVPLATIDVTSMQHYRHRNSDTAGRFPIGQKQTNVFPLMPGVDETFLLSSFLLAFR